MGVDFFPCDNCEESICDCGDYVRCNDECGRRWCDKKCAKGDGYRDDDLDDNQSCNFCRNEDVEDGPLLEFLLKHFKLSKKAAKEMYFNL